MGHPDGSNALYPGRQGKNMTYSLGVAVFSGRFRAVACAFALLALAGCTTANIEDAVPAGAVTPATAPAPAPNPQAAVVAPVPAPAQPVVPPVEQAMVDGPKDTGTFPNLNIPPETAAAQLTPAEKKALLMQLALDKKAQAKSGGPVKVANQAALNALARNHGKDTLKQIEGKCDPALDPTCK